MVSAPAVPTIVGIRPKQLVAACAAGANPTMPLHRSAQVAETIVARNVTLFIALLHRRGGRGGCRVAEH